MSRINERQRALELRKSGKSYSQIKKELGVSKSTLSLWLRKYPLSKQQIGKLRDFSAVRIEKYRETMRKKHEKRLEDYYVVEKSKLLPLSTKELFISGLFLYWGEGNKVSRGSVSINNTDPSVLKFSLYWIVNSLGIPKNKIEVFLHLYSDMNVEDEINFWSKELRMDKDNFSKPYIKENKRWDIEHKGFGHGTCGLRIHKTEIKERIMMAIKAIGDEYN